MYGDTEATIYSLIPSEEVKVGKAPKYNSKFKSHVRGESQQKKDDHKTMGQAKVPVPTTDNYLKKRSHEPQLPDKTEFHYPDDSRRRPPVPTKDEKPLMGLKTTKNFISTNAVENITSVPKKPEKIYCDTRKGDKHLIDPSGLEPIFTHKKDFGKTPIYLGRRKEDMDRAQKEYETYVSEHFKRGAMRQLTESEREMILNGLKANWEELHDTYQGLSVVTDTASKKNRKERMEAEMKSLERYIETMAKHSVIYIAN